MYKKIAVVAGAIVLSACSQLTTNAKELEIMRQTAELNGDSYVGCVKENAVRDAGLSAIDVASAVTLAQTTCQSELDRFKSAQEEYLGAQQMLTEKPLNASVDALNERATVEISEALLAQANSQPAAVAASAGAVAVTEAARTTAAPSTETSAGWSADQRVYLDCMEDQANKYAGLNESASVIADVAQSRCKSYMGPGNAALEQEGRTLVMGAVLDAKIKAPPGQ